LTQPSLAAYYDKLTLVIRGSLFDRNRLVEIWKLNTGQYDSWLAAYRPFFQVDLSGSPKRLWGEVNNLTDYAGIQLNLGSLSYARQAQISLSPQEAEITADQRDYQLIYYQGDSPVADQTLQLPAQIPQPEMTSRVEIPEAAALEGYDCIRILPREGEQLYPSIYSISEIRLLK
jgi:hypothetical protein